MKTYLIFWLVFAISAINTILLSISKITSKVISHFELKTPSAKLYYEIYDEYSTFFYISLSLTFLFLIIAIKETVKEIKLQD